MANPPVRPYQVSPDQLEVDLESLVSTTFEDMSSQFVLLPRGDAFVSYEEFRDGYEALRLATDGFTDVTPETCWNALRKNALAFIVLRAILGVSPPEWEDIAREEVGLKIPTNSMRALEGKIKRDNQFFSKRAGQTKLTRERVTGMLLAACKILTRESVEAPDGFIHRLDKVDTQNGLESVQRVMLEHIPYAVLLYERFLGRPFASHRDSVSELVGDVMESAIENLLVKAGIPFRKTKRAERVADFEQAPDFFIPDEIAPRIIIEAKVTGDDGTTRDKVARILRLAYMRDAREAEGKPSYELIACIDGRGFTVRRQDMRDLMKATRGKIFTLNTLSDLIPHTGLAAYATPSGSAAVEDLLGEATG